MTRLVMPLTVVILVSVIVAYFNVARIFPFLSNLWVSIVFGIAAFIAIYIIMLKRLREH